jgi:predicted kinase
MLVGVDKIALILRGVPGSGKSTLTGMVQRLHSKDFQVKIHAIDDLHRDSDGNFIWNEPKEKALYMLNYANFIQSCANNNPLVVCDCINIKISDFKPYVDAAKEFGYKVYVVTPDMPLSLIAEERNSHGVTKEQIKEMKKDWDYWPVKNKES